MLVAAVEQYKAVEPVLLAVQAAVVTVEQTQPVLQELLTPVQAVAAAHTLVLVQVLAVLVELV